MAVDLDETGDDDEVDELLAAVARIPPREAEWTPPSELEEYRLLRPLGRGGMGSVWLAEDKLLERLVAVKFIAHSEPDKHTRARFEIEARAAARLAHVNVVTVHRYGDIAGRPYLVSEYIRGESLDKLAKPIAWERALEIGVALTRGLAAAHRHGIVHRDIKPANAILTPEGEAKLVDFGLATLDRGGDVSTARASGLDLGSLTAAGAIAGTPLYLAPEVRRGEPASRRSDVYQIGCILYELVIGRAPLVDQLARGETALSNVAFDELDEVPSLGDQLEAGGRACTRFAAVVDRCLRRDPDGRFASGDELREELEQILAPARGGDALPAGNPYRGLVPFEAEHRALFFGRDSEIRAVLERLRSDSFVLVTGDSGVGKSSLCRAGALPRIAEGSFADRDAWTIVALVPGQRPLTTLASLLSEETGIDEDQLAATMREHPAAVGRELRRALGPERGLVVFLDQLEELSTLADRAEAEAVAAVLAELASGTPGLRLLATVRSDFLMRVAELPSIGGEIARALYLLRPLTEEGARNAIVGPANATGVRFESDALVQTLVDSVADGGGRSSTAVELPLLAFTLAQLWDARDPATDTISARSLDAIGGVKGALARHADRVLDSLLPAQRAAARKILLRLVTADRTRAPRSAAELAALDSAALDALVRGRLVVARGADTPTYELAHERLIDGWPTLAGWISEATEAIVVHARLARAVIDWERLERSRDALWNARQLADVAIIAPEDLTEPEAAFVRASRRTARRRRLVRIGTAIAIPVVVLLLYIGAKVVARRDLENHIATQLAEATPVLAKAREEGQAHSRQRDVALALFDTGDNERAEIEWARTQKHGADARQFYAEAARSLEQAFLLDTTRSDVRRELAQVTFERLRLAELEHREAERDELAVRLGVYDSALAARVSAPATITAVTDPPARVTILGANGEPRAEDGPLSPGSYIVEATAEGRTPVRLPVVLRPAEHRQVKLELPSVATVPAGYIYVPPGKFLYGSSEAEHVRRFFGTTPMHEVETDAYLIGRTEVTYAQWIEFLDHLDATERARRTPHVEASATYKSGALELRTLPDGKRELLITPASITYTAREDEPFEYRDRTTRRLQDWRQFPVSGVSADDAEAYAKWLNESGRLKHARLCNEYEWERAARGADGRTYPHGQRLAPDDANIDVTYGQKEGAYGPDAVGSHPASTSPHGLVDASGNVWEIVRSTAGGVVARGGTYYQTNQAAHLANRDVVQSSYRHVQVGIRICADAK